jgi:nitrous oxide reductase
MKNSMDRRGFLRAGAMVGAAACVSRGVAETVSAATITVAESPIRLGMASYTFRNFERAKVIEWM